MTFKELNLRAELISAVEELGYEQPMPVQEQVIPFMLTEQSDLVALAQTGTGKTAAFGLPILNMIDVYRREVQALVLAPTRELCIQISNDLKGYSKNMTDVHIVPVYGGEDIRKQLKELDRTPQIIVATPGRLIDLTERGKIQLGNINFLVFDEADEMLNMGFKDDIETILKGTPKMRRTLLFSATMPMEVQRIAKQYMRDFQEITVGERNTGNENVEHIYYVSQARQRYLVLKRIVDLNPDIYGIVFCRTRQETKEVAEKLMQDGYNADALHGDLSQPQRDAVMQKFRIKNVQLLVATDVAARGLDVSDLTHVINYNLPDDVEIYTHRSGRTGRANKTGVSVSIIHSKEKFKIKDIEKMLKRKFEQRQIPNGLEVCKKQLFYQIDKMQNVEVNDAQIEPYMAQIMNQLEYLSKEELLKRFVSLEFNRFLDYYRNAPDLNVNERLYESESSHENGGRKRKKSGERVRLKINVGNREGMNPKRILGIINEITDDKSINIGDIEITNKFTFFDVFEDQKDKVLSAFEGTQDLDVSIAKGSRSNNKDGLRNDNSREKRFSEKRNTFRNDRKSDGGKHGSGRKREDVYSSKSDSDKPWRNKRR